jgi:hypothetical protein
MFAPGALLLRQDFPVPESGSGQTSTSAMLFGDFSNRDAQHWGAAAGRARMQSCAHTASLLLPSKTWPRRCLALPGLSLWRCVECTKCDRRGRYRVHKLIEKYGRKGNMMKWREMLNADCPKRDGRLNDRCDLTCPDLPKVL